MEIEQKVELKNRKLTSCVGECEHFVRPQSDLVKLKSQQIAWHWDNLG